MTRYSPQSCNSTAMTAPAATKCQLRSDEARGRSAHRECDMVLNGDFGVGRQFVRATGCSAYRRRDGVVHVSMKHARHDVRGVELLIDHNAGKRAGSSQKHG